MVGSCVSVGRGCCVFVAVQTRSFRSMMSSHAVPFTCFHKHVIQPIRNRFCSSSARPSHSCNICFSLLLRNPPRRTAGLAVCRPCLAAGVQHAAASSPSPVQRIRANQHGSGTKPLQSCLQSNIDSQLVAKAKAADLACDVVVIVSLLCRAYSGAGRWPGVKQRHPGRRRAVQAALRLLHKTTVFISAFCSARC